MIELAITMLVLSGVALLVGVTIGLVWLQEGPPPWWTSRQTARMAADELPTDPGPPGTATPPEP